MKIVDLIKIIGLDKENSMPFILLEPGQYSDKELAIYPTSRGICFYKEQDVWFLSINDKNKIYDIEQSIQRNIREVYNNVRELNRYLAISELLIAIDRFYGGKGVLDLDKAKIYVDKVDKAIIEALSFDEISNMKNLIDIIKGDELYREMLFVVNEIGCNRDDRYKGYKKQENYYSFGNQKYHEDLDVVDITVYNDFVEILHRAEGREHERKLDQRRQNTVEEKIISALDCWRCYF